jgi:DNA invertase Pin-like site-specific DNA recombinase
VALDSPTDLTTASGEAMAGVMAVFAQLERRLISERTRAALAALKAEGMVLGRPRVVGVNLAAQIRALRESGSTLASIAEWLNDAGVPTAHGGERWWPATVRNIAQQR